MDTKHVIKELNDLVEKNHDAVDGFQNAAEKVKDHDLKNFLMEHVHQRNQFNSELRQEITSLGGTPKETKEGSASLHQTWMDIKSALSSNKEEAVLEECIRGDKNALKEYQDVLQETEVPDNVKTTVRKQMEKIETSLQELVRLEERYD
ncbi:MAG: PA2169 family four-helix-bundle protein [Tunicatimonas sp.]|uniref:ferritin-like domain-containing protein n=1 Tax=Tunicatimonas sp. TaxID=1940096 RepID=UPI003C778F93